MAVTGLTREERMSSSVCISWERPLGAVAAYGHFPSPLQEGFLKPFVAAEEN
jgi:hypothetical protein